MSPPTCGTCNGSGTVHTYPLGGIPCVTCARREGRVEGLREAAAVLTSIIKGCYRAQLMMSSYGPDWNVDINRYEIIRSRIEALLLLPVDERKKS